MSDSSENLIHVLTSILEKIHATDFNLKVVMETILDYVVDSTGADVGTILLVDETKSLRTVAVRGEFHELMREPRYSFDDRSVQNYVLRAGEPLLVNDVQQETSYRPIWRNIQSELACPIIMSGQVLGVINLEHSTKHAFSEDDLKLTKLIAAQAASALRVQRLRNIDEITRAEREVLAKQTCFVLMLFSEPFNRYYTAILGPAADAAGLRPVRADDLFGPANLTRDIWEGIKKARCLIAELTGRNPNVMYELGLAHALQKPVVLITQNHCCPAKLFHQPGTPAESVS